MFGMVIQKETESKTKSPTNLKSDSMNNETPKLSLIKPNWATDEIAYTLESLADNFDKIDEVLAPNYAEAPPTTGTWQAKYMIHNDKPDIGQYVGSP